MEIAGCLGYLTLNGNETLFAIDGQHRVCGIKQALKKKKDMKSDEVCVLFIAHKTDEKGHERTRRLFTRLNRFAKPVRKEEIIALDEDDVIAITTRRILDEDKRFIDKIYTKNTKSLPPTDKENITSISTFYDCLDCFFNMEYTPSAWKEYKQNRPSDKILEEYYKKSIELWTVFEKISPELKEVLSNPAASKIAGKYRNLEGGHLLFRPIGLLIIIKTLVQFIKAGIGLSAAAKRIMSVPMLLRHAPWAGLLWDKTNRRMITRSENQKVAIGIIYYGAGGNLDDMKIDLSKLKRQIAGITNREEKEIHLSVYWK